MKKKSLTLSLIAILVLGIFTFMTLHDKKSQIKQPAPKQTQKPIETPVKSDTSANPAPVSNLPGTFISFSETFVSQSGSARTYTLSCRYEISKDNYIDVDKGKFTSSKSKEFTLVEDNNRCITP